MCFSSTYWYSSISSIRSLMRSWSPLVLQPTISNSLRYYPTNSEQLPDIPATHCPRTAQPRSGVSQYPCEPQEGRKACRLHPTGSPRQSPSNYPLHYRTRAKFMILRRRQAVFNFVMETSTVSRLAVALWVLQGAWAAALCPPGQMWSTLQFNCIVDRTTPSSSQSKQQQVDPANSYNCPPGKVWAALIQGCIVDNFGQQISQTQSASNKVSFTVLPTTQVSKGFVISQDNTPFITNDLFQPTPVSNTAPVP
mgnify:FL=1